MTESTIEGTSEIEQYVRFYLKNGITPIPCYPQTKEPCVQWRDYQDFKPIEDELKEWFRTVWNPQTWRNNSYWKSRWIKARRKALVAEGKTPEEIKGDPKLLEYDGSLSVAVLGGKTSNNLVYFDDDNEVLSEDELEEFKNKTIVTKTKDGHHIWLQTYNTIKTKKGKNGELRGEGAYVMAPPSVHVLGYKYVTVSNTKQILKLDSEERETEFLKWASEKLCFTTETTQKEKEKPLDIEVDGCYEWHKQFLMRYFVDDHINYLSLTLFAPSMVKAKVPKEKAAEIIYEWAKRCNEEKGAALTVDIEKIEKMYDSAKKHNITPLSQDGLKKKIPELYAKLEEEGIIRQQQPKADSLLEMIKDKEPLYFHDQYRTPHIYIEDQGIHKVFKINSQEFRRFLHYLFFKTQGESIKPDQLKAAIVTLEAFSNYGKQIELHNRVTSFGKGENLEIWIDICDEKWRAIKVTKDGWGIIEKTPPMFRRYNHMQPFTIPQKQNGTYGTDGTYDTYGINGRSIISPIRLENIKGGGKSLMVISSVSSVSSEKPLDRFFKHVNVSKKDRLLTKVLIVSYFIPDVPHVGNCVNGPKGSAKSTFHKLVKLLIDPSAVLVLDLPSDKNELLQVLFHHYVVWFDNINYLPNWISDLFCRVITGAGAQKRQLYTDDEDIVYRLLRVLGFNGINIAAVKEDLLDRLVLLQLESISPENRKSQDQLYEEFNKDKPFLIYEILKALSKAINIYPTIAPPKLFRMADFTKWGCAIAEALGYTHQEFLDAYEGKCNDQIKEAVYNDLLGSVFYDFMENKKEWSGKASDLFQNLKGHAKFLGVSTRVKEFPKAPNILARRLNLLLESLNKLGITIEQLADGHRTIQITNSNYVPPEEAELEKGKNVRTSEQKNKPKKDINLEAFQIQCYGCRKTLQKHEVYSDNTGKPFCRECRLKQEDQKKQGFQCPEHATVDGRPFCNRIQQVLAKPEDCSPDYSLLKEDP